MVLKIIKSVIPQFTDCILPVSNCKCASAISSKENICETCDLIISFLALNRQPFSCLRLKIEPRIANKSTFLFRFFSTYSGISIQEYKNNFSTGFYYQLSGCWSRLKLDLKPNQHQSIFKINFCIINMFVCPFFQNKIFIFFLKKFNHICFKMFCDLGCVMPYSARCAMN